jgi:hypothetical protein
MTTTPRAFSADNQEAQRERERSKGRYWTIGALLMFPLFLLSAYWFALRSKAASYVMEPRFSYGPPLTARVDPKPHVDGLGKGPDSFFLVDHKGNWWIFNNLFEKPMRLRFDQLPGEAGHEQLGTLGSFGSFPMERYPVGGVDDVARAFQASDWEAFSERAEALAAAMPERLTPKYWAIAGRCADGDVEGAQRLWDRWRVDFERSTSWRAKWYIRLVESDLRAAQPGEEARRADYARFFPNGATSSPAGAGPALGEVLGWLAAQREQPPRTMLSLSTRFVPDFLTTQIDIKLARVYSVFLLASGQREQAIDLLLGSLVAARGVGTPDSGTLIGYLIHIACESLLTVSLQDALAKAPVSAAELEAIWPDLEKHFAADARGTESDMMALETPHLAYAGAMPTAMSGGATPNYLEAWTRRQVANAAIDLLREGVRARHVQATTGEWPAIGPDDLLLGLLLQPAASIADVFEPARPLRAERTVDALRLWSVGPDGVDDRGLLQYDPTNGTTSAGDVILELDDTPRFGFPSDPGYVYQGMADWNARYPKGLPRDPFSNMGWEPLRLSTDGTNRLWSFGPDGDQGSGAWPDPTVHLLTHYDPTNGTVSRGDLWVEIPFAAEAK